MYCVYLTIYFGNKLPRRYIGSTKVERIHQRYNGSIKSKKYKDLYLEEQSENKHLFKTRILTYHDSQEDAIKEELRLHIKYDVVKSENYMNMSLASPNGCFGRNTSGMNHPMFGKIHDENTKTSISNTLKEKYKSGELTSPFALLDVSGKNNPFYGKIHSEDTKQKMRKPKRFVPKFECIHCGIIMDAGNLKQHIMKKHT
jgi:hypothetical protein